MRIVHVIPALEPGGAEEVLLNLAICQKQYGCEVLVVATWADDVSRKRLVEGGVPLEEIGTGPGWLSIPKALRWIKLHRSLLLEADVIHSHLTYGSLFAALLKSLAIGRNLERPVIVETDHATGARLSLKTRSIYRLSRRYCDAVVTVMRDGVPSTHPPRSTLHFNVPNGIHPLPMRSSLELHQPLLLGSLGLLRKDRAPERYLDVVRALSETVSLRFMYGGDGPERAFLEQKVDSMGLSSVVAFAGLVRDKYAFLSGLDAHVSIAVGPDVGLASLESASIGTPSFAIQTATGFPDVDFPFPTRAGPAELAHLLDLFLGSPGSLRELGQEQAAYVREQRSVEKMMHDYFRVYEACLAQPQ